MQYKSCQKCGRWVIKMLLVLGSGGKVWAEDDVVVGVGIVTRGVRKD